MAEQEWSQIRIGVVTGLGASAVGSLATTLVPGGWEWVGLRAARFGAWMTADVAIPNWWHCLLLGCTAVGFLALLALRSEDGNRRRGEAEIGGVRWRWQWSEGRAESPRSYCPTCDLELVPADGDETRTDRFRCENCQVEIGSFDDGITDVPAYVSREAERRNRDRDLRDETRHAA